MISIIVPCYNEQEALPLSTRKLPVFCRRWGNLMSYCWSMMAPEIAHWT